MTDYIMRVGTTNVRFVAQLPAILLHFGPQFRPQDIRQAKLRAASTLTQTALIRGQSLQFLRLAIPWDEATAAAFLGVTVLALQGIEAETLSLSTDVWIALADYVAHLDGRFHYDSPPPCPSVGWQARTIRIHPDLLVQSTQQSEPVGCTPC